MISFKGNDLALLVQNIVRGSYKPVPKVFSTCIEELIKVMLKPDPAKRPSSEQVFIVYRACH